MTKYYYVIHFPGSDYDSRKEKSDAYYGNGLFDSYEEASEAACYEISCYKEGSETLHLSNPGDWDYEEDIHIDFDVEEFDDEEENEDF